MSNRYKSGKVTFSPAQSAKVVIIYILAKQNRWQAPAGKIPINHWPGNIFLTACIDRILLLGLCQGNTKLSDEWLLKPNEAATTEWEWDNWTYSSGLLLYDRRRHHPECCLRLLGHPSRTGVP